MILVGDSKEEWEMVIYLDGISLKGAGSNGFQAAEGSKEHSLITFCPREGTVQRRV